MNEEKMNAPCAIGTKGAVTTGSEQRVPIHLKLTLTIKEAAEYIGNKVVQQLLPSNKNVKRFYFNTSSPIMKDADRYWKSGNYDYASYLWEYMYETNKKNYFKAMAAANLALYNELKDNYIQAEIWARISIDLFKDNSEERKMMENYLKELKKRIEDDQILRFQLI